ncbi:acyl-protein synthetase [Acinetobacter sp. WCHA45]|uniref:LuxE/PaaK family acyltransferase n=1 Tax=Acinetobacter sp. WCHA45 TaxID=2004644 RepID=UPI000B3CA669|nr:acyl-protein synthetase [Acinetobacter sp. WCHA45]AVZ84746.1 acyl-protein synthetase [Acinetobacter sp. WCHA45]
MIHSFNLLDIHQPYGFSAKQKDVTLLAVLNELTTLHIKNCPSYANIVERLFPNTIQAESLEDVPFLPVSLFKSMNLKSVPESEIIKILTSSGTTGQAVSHIYLDRETSIRQTQVLSAIIASFLGNKRLPMVVVDSADLLKDRTKFNARTAGILGFSIYGRDHCYCLNDKLELDASILKSWLDKYTNTPVLIFGFTFIVWQGLYQSAIKQGIKLRFPKGSLLIHGGGWKRLIEQSVSNNVFKASLNKLFGIEHVHNYYGMVEQAGTIYMECEHGFLHTSSNSNIIIRNPYTLKPVKIGEEGIIQVQSSIPLSYSGHSLLTEDIGTIHGKDNCKCGRLGEFFTVNGRLPKAEIRGCSDTRAF